MPRVVACTIVAHNYLPLARVVARSFLNHHPDARFVVGVIDRPLEARALTGECFEVMPITDIDFGSEGFELMATIYDVTEFATSIKPFLLRQLAREADCVLYLDPDIEIYDSLDPLIASTIAAGWSVTPHCLAPIPRNQTGPTEADIMQSGIYNLGYIGVTEAATPMLDWWAERLRRDAIIDPANHMFTDQRWIDLAVPIFSPHVEMSPEYNVAYWNVDQRNFTCVGGKPMVGDQPVRFFHFSGYDPKAPHWLSKYQVGNVRSLMSEQPGLGEFCVRYGEALKAEGKGVGPVAPYGWAQAFPGFRLDHLTRRAFRAELVASAETDAQAPPSPFASGGARRFYDWLLSVRVGNERNLPRYLDLIWVSRHDLQVAFPEVSGGSLDRFLHWISTQGPAECPILPLFPKAANRSAAPIAAGTNDGQRTSAGVDVVGYFNAELGVGEAGRLAVAALTAAGVAVSTIGSRRTGSRQQHEFATQNDARYKTALIAVNADQLPTIRHDLRDQFVRHEYLVGQWFWELDEFPSSMHASFGLINEVWAATRHIQRALQAVAPSTVPVTLMQLPLLAPQVLPEIDKAYYGLPDRFMFLFTFDFLSVLERKNPMAVVEAFTRAFAPGEGPILVLKTINGSKQINDLERLKWACRLRSDIILIDEYFESVVSASLVNVCDCYVSLHRAEGLGLTMAEAMTLGKPVIATGYSGNLDFMSDSTAYLVPYKTVAIGHKAAPYPATATWADPDVDAAADLMRHVYGNKAEATQRGEAAKSDLLQRFSSETTGAKMRNRLTEIGRLQDV
jgi:glycosyltransferase involved in cell wall biosynthesis